MHKEIDWDPSWRDLYLPFAQSPTAVFPLLIMAAVPIVIDQIRDLFDIAEIDPLISLVIDFCHLPDVASLNASCTRLHISMATPLQRMRKEMVDTCLEKFPQSDYARNKRAERYYQQYTKAFGRNLKDNYNYNSGSGEIILKISALLFNAVKLQDSRMVEMIFAEPLVKSFVPCGHFCRYGDYGQSFFAGNDYDWYDDEQMSGISLLHYATEINALRIIDLIVNSKTEIVNSRNYWGFNAFHVAAWNLNVEALEVLLKHSQDVNCQTNNSYGWSSSNTSDMGLYPIHCALLAPAAGRKFDATTKEKSTKIIKMLLAHGANLNVLTGPLMFNSEPPYRQCAGRKGNGYGISGVSMLHLAVAAQNANAVKLLVDNGAMQIKLSLEGVPNYIKIESGRRICTTCENPLCGASREEDKEELEAKNILFYSSTSSEESPKDIFSLLNERIDSIRDCDFPPFPCRRFSYPITISIAARAKVQVDGGGIENANDVTSFLHEMNEISTYLESCDFLSLPVDTELVGATESWEFCDELVSVSIDSKFKSLGKSVFVSSDTAINSNKDDSPIKMEENDTGLESLETLIELGDLHLQAGQLDEAIHYYEATINESKRREDLKKMVGYVYFGLGEAYALKRELKKSFDFFVIYYQLQKMVDEGAG